MKKFIISAIVVIALVLYVIFNSGKFSQKTDNTASTTPDLIIDNPSTATTTPDNNPVSTGKYKDGTYTGNDVDAYFGRVQVQAVIKGGAISDVKILKSPSGPGTTNRITANTIPVLIKEAVSVQTSKVDIVSGATQTSEGFQQSLASALALAVK